MINKTSIDRVKNQDFCSSRPETFKGKCFLNVAQKTHQKATQNNITPVPYLRAFIAQRSPVANRWLNRMHLDKKARYLTSAQVKIAFWITVGINLIVE